MVRQEHHRPSVRRYLDRTEHHALTGEFTRPGSLQRGPLGTQADVVARRGDPVRVGEEVPDRPGREPVVAGPRCHPQHELDRWARLRGTGHAGGRWARGAERQERAVVERRRPQTGQQVGGAAAEARLRGDAAGDGHVAAHARRGRAHLQPHTGRHRDRGARNRRILRCLRAGGAREAERLLTGYLADSLERMVEVYRRQAGDGGRIGT
ncbi:hypothetical protein LK08_29350 [Streptomyces sp. MUSC 125]|nr:hypothetical protein LK08_29350 [Streptomyces sp. MUSC 125]